MEVSIEQFNKVLNESIASQNAYVNWMNYREAITDFCISGMKSKGTCIVLGAGNLQDIDLARLKNVSSELTLADIDTAAVRRGLETQKITDSLTVMKTDLGGLDSNRVMKTAADLINECTPEKLKRFFQSYIYKSDIKSAEFSTVVVSAIYTQLFLPQFLLLLQQSSQSDSDRQQFVETALYFTAGLISHVNDTIIKLAGGSGAVCAWSDILEFNTEDPALADIMAHIDDKPWMDELYMTYVRDYGHGLGSFGISDLAERLDKVKENWLLWPFNENRTLVVKIISGIVTS